MGKGRVDKDLLFCGFDIKSSDGFMKLMDAVGRVAIAELFLPYYDLLPPGILTFHIEECVVSVEGLENKLERDFRRHILFPFPLYRVLNNNSAW